MALLNRETIRNLFRRGSRPTEGHFADMIDSMVNRVDDGFAKSLDGGLGLAPQESSKRVVSFYSRAKDRHAAMHIAVNPEVGANGMSFRDEEGKDVLFLRRRGYVGIGTLEPEHKLDVGGMMAMEGRVGTYAAGKVPADGFWHPILEGLNDLQAFEVMAEVRRPVLGRTQPAKSALLHALAISAFGGAGSHHKVKATQFGWFWNRLKLRWAGDTHDYQLQIRSFSNYGKIGDEEVMINYRICRLWGEDAPTGESIIGEKP